MTSDPIWEPFEVCDLTTDDTVTDNTVINVVKLEKLVFRDAVSPAGKYCKFYAFDYVDNPLSDKYININASIDGTGCT